MKLQLIITTMIIALMITLPLVSAAMQQGNKILPVVSDKGEMTREQLREKFFGEESFRAQLRNEIRNCIGKDTEECKKLREQVRTIAKDVIGKSCQNTNQIMERIKTRIQNNPKLTDEEKETLIRVINEQETKLKDLCGGIEDRDMIQLRERVREIKQLMKETKVKFGLTKELIQAKRVGLVLERAEQLEVKLQRFIEKWNVTNCNIENLTEQFNAKIAEARESYNDSVDLWQQFKESVQNHDPNTELLREAQAKMQLAQLKLKEAHLILKDIIVELRECRQIEKVEGNETEETPGKPQEPIEPGKFEEEESEE